jgi:hypothetical protein
VLGSVEVLESDERDSLLVRYLMAVLRAGLPRALVDTTIAAISERFSDFQALAEVFRLAQQVMSTGDRSVLAGLGPDVRSAVETVLDPDDAPPDSSDDGDGPRPRDGTPPDA